MKTSFAQQVINFNHSLQFTDNLPKGFEVMNPYQNQKTALVSDSFYKKFYCDHNLRHLILGINPGRHGAGVTGIPFTDSKRLQSCCAIDPQGLKTHEPSSVFIYRLIEEFGGAKQFYAKFYFNSPSPLGFLRHNSLGNLVNANYYDSPALIAATENFINTCMNKLLQMPLHKDKVWCLGIGKNYQMLRKMNNKYNWFKQLIPLEHPRFIMQYKSKQIDKYIRKFIQELK